MWNRFCRKIKREMLLSVPKVWCPKHKLQNKRMQTTLNKHHWTKRMVNKTHTCITNSCLSPNMLSVVPGRAGCESREPSTADANVLRHFPYREFTRDTEKVDWWLCWREEMVRIAQHSHHQTSSSLFVCSTRLWGSITGWGCSCAADATHSAG